MRLKHLLRFAQHVAALGWRDSRLLQFVVTSSMQSKLSGLFANFPDAFRLQESFLLGGGG